MSDESVKNCCAWADCCWNWSCVCGCDEDDKGSNEETELEKFCQKNENEKKFRTLNIKYVFNWALITITD